MGHSEVKNMVYLLLDMELVVRAQQCPVFDSEQGPAHTTARKGSLGPGFASCLRSFMKHLLV